MCNRGTERAERVDRSAEELREGRVAAFCRCNWFSGSSVFGENSSEKKCTGSGLFSFKSGNPQNILNESHTVSHCFLGREKRFIGSENFEIKTATWIESSHPDESVDQSETIELSKVQGMTLCSRILYWVTRSYVFFFIRKPRDPRSQKFQDFFYFDRWPWDPGSYWDLTPLPQMLKMWGASRRVTTGFS